MAHGAALGVLPLAGGPGRAADVHWRRYCMVVHDERFELANSIATRAEAHGATLRAISGDITELWFDDLYHRWRTGPAPVAGVTLESSAVQLGHFARDQRHVLRYPTGIATDGTGLGASQPTALLSESMTPIRLVSWIIEPLSADPPPARLHPFRFAAL